MCYEDKKAKKRYKVRATHEVFTNSPSGHAGTCIEKELKKKNENKGATD